MATRHHHWQVRVGAPMHGPPRIISAQYSTVRWAAAWLRPVRVVRDLL